MSHGWSVGQGWNGRTTVEDLKQMRAHPDIQKWGLVNFLGISESRLSRLFRLPPEHVIHFEHHHWDILQLYHILISLNVRLNSPEVKAEIAKYYIYKKD